MIVCVFQFLFRYFLSVWNIQCFGRSNRFWLEFFGGRCHFECTFTVWHSMNGIFVFFLLFSLHSTIHEKYQILLKWIVFCWYCWRYRPSEKNWRNLSSFDEKSQSQWTDEWNRKHSMGHLKRTYRLSHFFLLLMISFSLAIKLKPFVWRFFLFFIFIANAWENCSVCTWFRSLTLSFTMSSGIIFIIFFTRDSYGAARGGARTLSGYNFIGCLNVEPKEEKTQITTNTAPSV